MFYKRIKDQRGFTLIELMIGIVVGLVAMAATIAAVTGIIRSNSNYLKMVRLNQELNAVMNLMVRDLKRAGHSGTADGKTINNVFMNTSSPPYNNNTIYTGTSYRATSDPNSCISFSYDIDDDGNLDGGTEEFGYRLDKDLSDTDGVTAVEVRDSVDKCNVAGWENITDGEVVQINTLTFTPDHLSFATGDEAIRYINIELVGELVSDPGVKRTLTERVRVRNDRP